MWSDLKFRLRALFSRPCRERELQEEIASHLERQIAKYIDKGFSPEESARLARIDFGALEKTKEECRAERGIPFLTTTLDDVRSSSKLFRRQLRSKPLLTLTMIFCLAIGIGGTTAVFSVVNGILLKPLPYPDSDRLVVLHAVNRETIGDDQGRVSAAELRDWQSAARSFEAITGYKWMTVDLLGADRSERLQGLWVTPEFFKVFGVQASAGHVFTADEASAVGIVLGRSLWERDFALDPSIVGRMIPLGICCPQQPRTIEWPVIGAIGTDSVFPPTIPNIRDAGHGLNDTIDYWAPVYLRHAVRPGPRELEAVGKLKRGVGAQQAQLEMNLVAQQLAEKYPDTNRGWTIQVVPIQDELFSNLRPILTLFMAAAGFVLLIACSNVAVLLTFNALGRIHEVAVRAALGGGTRRLVRQFLIESLLLFLCGGAGGLLVALTVKRFLVRLAPANVPRLGHTTLDLRVLGFALLTTLICGLAVGLIPILRILKFDFESTLRAENARNATSHARARTYEPLLTLQVALTVVLTIGAGLMVRSLDELLAVPPGFRPTNLLTATLSLPSAKHAWAYNAQFGKQVVERIRSLPGIKSAAYVRGVPLAGNETRFQGQYWPSEKPVVDSSKELEVRLRVVSPGYFETMSIPLEGRDFIPADEAGEKIGEGHRVIINEALARLFWPGQRAVGHSLNRGLEVIGVAGNVRYAGMDSDPIPEVYLPAGLFPQDEFSIVVRTAFDPAATTASIRSAIYGVERDVFVSDFQTMKEVIANSVSQRRFVMSLLGTFSVIGVLMAIVGIGGIVAYSLSMRLREVGIRIAMGAGPRSVLLLVSRQGLVPALTGVLLGLPLALILTGSLRHMLYGVSPYDPTVLTSTTVALLVVSFLAAVISGYRACRVDANSLLR